MKVITGDCVEVMKRMPEASVDSIVTDPPYDLTAKKRGGSGVASVNLDSPYGRSRIGTGNGSGGFMGQAWDGTGVALDPETWRAALRVLKPGGHLLAFGGSRTYHRLACAVEDAGFEVRDTIMWCFGSGFPKGHRVDQAIFKEVRRWLSKESVPFVEQVSESILLKLSVEREPIALAAARIQPEGDQALLMGTGREDGSYALTATLLSRSEAESIALNTMLSWSLTSVGHCDQMRKSITITRSEMTTDWGIWCCSLVANMLAITTPDETIVNGHSWPACSVVDRSSGSSENLNGIPVLSVLGDAISNPVEAGRGFNVALKPAMEPIIVARKPLAEKTVAKNVLKYGTGALNIDGCRIGTTKNVPASISRHTASEVGVYEGNRDGSWGNEQGGVGSGHDPNTGRWPANVILDPEAGAMLDAQTGTLTSGKEPEGGLKRNQDKFCSTYAAFAGEQVEQNVTYGDTGGASRFFYSAKVSTAERSAGLPEGERSTHPTMKPISLMRWLVRLVTPPGGRVLDPFTGSGSTGCACVLEGFVFGGIEQDPEYVEIAKARIAHWASTINHKGEPQ